VRGAAATVPVLPVLPAEISSRVPPTGMTQQQEDVGREVVAAELLLLD
jgi:hypothetical protein